MSKILIIEDEVAIADLEKDYLELSGFDVQIEYAGDKGLTRALKEDFDLIVLDLMLPGIDGFEVCRRIREEKNVPILMVSHFLHIHITQRFNDIIPHVRGISFHRS